MIRGGLVLMALLTCAAGTPCVAQTLAHLAKQGAATQLIVDGHAYLILGGELANSSASDLNYLQKLWPALEGAGLNTVLAPVEWDQIEAEEGRFDFSVLDGLLLQAGAHHLHVVLLWFGSWKNSMSTYVPPWVKHDFKRFARARAADGVAQDILSPYDLASAQADARAFAALMAHLKSADLKRTVILVQVENEIGMLPSARDHSAAADAALAAPVPQALMNALRTNREHLNPILESLWAAQGHRTGGSWADVFGAGAAGEEVFQAWGFAAYVEIIAKAGRAVYPIPLYLNVALNRPGKLPGEYPSAGPLPHLFLVWKTAAPDIDFIAPDIYFADFVGRLDQFAAGNSPVFIPEAGHVGDAAASANILYAIGTRDAIGASPFSIEHLEPHDALIGAYAMLHQLAPLILAHAGQGEIRGLRAPVAYDGTVNQAPQIVDLGAIRFTANFVDPFTASDKQDVASHGALLIQTGPDEFVAAGKGVTLAFADPAGKFRIGIEQIVEGQYQDGQFVAGRWLNGDESHQGRLLRLPPDAWSIQHLKLYRFQ
jgi:beta-galactosidase GanA